MTLTEFQSTSEGATKAAMISDLAATHQHYTAVGRATVLDSATKLIGDSRIARDLTDRVYALPNG